MPESQSPVSEGEEIFIPSESDRDPRAEAQMQQGKGYLDPNNTLYDPWFEGPGHAQVWTPEGVKG
jgi:hypothetical protein